MNLYIIKAGQANTAAINLTPWLTGQTLYPNNSNIISTFSGFVLNKVDNSHLIVTLTQGKYNEISVQRNFPMNRYGNSR